MYILGGRSDILRFSNVDFLEGNSLMSFRHCCQHGQNVSVTKRITVLQGHTMISHRCAVGKKKGILGSCLHGKLELSCYPSSRVPCKMH